MPTKGTIGIGVEGEASIFQSISYIDIDNKLFGLPASLTGLGTSGIWMVLRVKAYI